MELSRRDFLYVATATVGVVGVAASFVPLIAQMNPDASTLAAGAAADFDLTDVRPGQQVLVRWRERPVFVINRTPTLLARISHTK
jgi:ubiquinol-cytochrome c reductase iron-sulfur subunit